MPELPDVAVYVEALERRVLGTVLREVRVKHLFVLRTFDPPLEALAGTTVDRIARVGKRIAFGCSGELWLVMHLMIAGRLQWRLPSGKVRRSSKGSAVLAELEFDSGVLMLTEAGTQRRAALSVFRGADALDGVDPGGLEVLGASLPEFTARLTSVNHTLKRALTDPHLLSGIGNAYSDEILHRARMSPFAQTQKLDPLELERLYFAIREVLQEWIARLRDEAGDQFPTHVTAFRPEMAVHGRYGLPCPVCGTLVQRIRYADNETNYCPRCQTEGRVLADRSLSRLLKDDWPKRIEDWE